MTNYLTTGFSLNMLQEGTRADVTIEPCDAIVIPSDVISVIGHSNTAAIIGKILGREIIDHRETIILIAGDVVYAAQYRGTRLSVGATSLPEGASIEFYRVKVNYP